MHTHTILVSPAVACPQAFVQRKAMDEALHAQRGEGLLDDRVDLADADDGAEEGEAGEDGPEEGGVLGSGAGERDR